MLKSHTTKHPAKPRLKTRPGSPLPLGARREGRHVNFAVFSSIAEEMMLCLFEPDAEEPLYQIPLSAKTNRTGQIWHIAIDNLGNNLDYSYRVKGPHQWGHRYPLEQDVDLLDPHARYVSSHRQWSRNPGAYVGRAMVPHDLAFDWEGDATLKIPMQDLIIYEMHVRGFTQDRSSHVQNPGSFAGLIEKIPYLQKLGINAVELMPIFEFHEGSYHGVNPLTQEQLHNYWGYSTLNFFCPMTRYASTVTGRRGAEQAVLEFKALVRELHKAGIEVILDVVYNHTGESASHGPSISFRGLAPEVYYMTNSRHQLFNYSGCGNTFNCNHPVVRELILESLRYWVTEMHVDGFRFDLASIMTRARNGKVLANPPLIDAITNDPVLADTKLISESWDAAGLYQVGHFPSWGRWSEWNGAYRDGMRRFIKGTNEQTGSFATSICGSSNLYQPHGFPTSSINFITSHDGFTLHDLVSYSEKHNAENGEESRDGMNDNESWNCGVEGATDKKLVRTMRERQMRNLHMALMLSQGVPMVLMGDEYGHTREGNNNTWCQDNALNWFQWEGADQDRHFFTFWCEMIQFRKRQSILRQGHFLSEGDITWHGHLPNEIDWSETSRFVGLTLYNKENGYDLYIAFNADYREANVTLPESGDGWGWHKVVDTALRPPKEFVHENDAEHVPTHAPYRMLPHSSILLIRKPTTQQ